MKRFNVRRAAVLGAGVMGAQIAAHLVNAGVPVLLYDLPAKDGDKNGIVGRAIDGLRKLSPAPLGVPSLADAIEPANYADDLERLGGCDLIIEAIAERLDWKHDLYARITPYVGEDAILASNTSGLSITALSEGFDAGLQRRFCGVHFFNPPRYMHLVELIPTVHTDPQVLDTLETFLTRVLGKGVVRAKDTPNFIANRVGIYGMLATIAEAEAHGLSYDVVDDLTGARLGRAKSGTFRTADVVGLDTMGHVIRTMQDSLPDDPFAPLYATPKVLTALIEKGALGQKSGAGFYRKEGRNILRLDPAKGEYVPAGAKADETVARILKKKDWGERLKLLRESSNPQAQFLWAVMRDGMQYAAVKLEEIADNARDLDLALRFGFGWSEGPFEIWQQAGWDNVAGWIRDDIAAGKALVDVPLPDWVFEGPVAQRGGVHQSEGSFSPSSGEFVRPSDLPVYARQVSRAPVFNQSGGESGRTLFEDDDIRLFTLERADLGRVLIASIRSKMHAIGPGVTAGLLKAVAMAEAEYEGLVIWSPDEPFSVGADLQAMLPVFMKGGAAAIGPEEKKLQDAMMALRYAQIPVVAAVSGMALGGGCELALHCARRVVNIESYIGLVEVGVGLIPGAGGLTYGARRASESRESAPDVAPLAFLRRYFMAAATAQVSRSAHEAMAMGYLLDSDRIVFNRHELLYRAVREARGMADAGYRAPLPARIAVAGRDTRATIQAQLVNMRDGAQISDYDYEIGSRIAHVMCGGDLDAGTEVDEAWYLALEREAFVALLGNPKTQERIMGMMQTGKPVRN